MPKICDLMEPLSATECSFIRQELFNFQKSDKVQRRSPWAAFGGSGAAVRPEQLWRNAGGPADGRARARKAQGGRADAEARDCVRRCVAGSGGTAGCRDSSGAWRLQLARRRPEWRKATEVKPLRGTLEVRSCSPLASEEEPPEILRRTPCGPLLEDTRQYPVEGGEGCDRGGPRKVNERRISGWAMWAERA
ncbi:hypothetical protein NDU88_003637 [Pleurodeles waltl]|uniref:Uncharacterized protein n=1 Tax=Pleurodeles waltl TaxID=8319 RepID=A0AAV7MUV9_PLEWA|nr:hypothetical protein NDU88_003637 [Pleurodeles waltl]